MFSWQMVVEVTLQVRFTVLQEVKDSPDGARYKSSGHVKLCRIPDSSGDSAEFIFYFLVESIIFLVESGDILEVSGIVVVVQSFFIIVVSFVVPEDPDPQAARITVRSKGSRSAFGFNLVYIKNI